MRGPSLRRASPNLGGELSSASSLIPVVSSLLITIGMLGIILEIRTPGFGVPGALGISKPRAFLLGALAGPVRRLGRAVAFRNRARAAWF